MAAMSSSRRCRRADPDQGAVAIRQLVDLVDTLLGKLLDGTVEMPGKADERALDGIGHSGRSVPAMLADLNPLVGGPLRSA